MRPEAQPQDSRAAADGPAAWADGLDCLALLAVDPAGLGGIVLRAQAGPVRDAWLALLPALFGAVRRMPATIGDAALLGGLDLAATLQAGRRVASPGLLDQARGGVLVSLMAERMTPGVAARLTMALDAGPGFAVVALDEGIGPDEHAPPALADRLAFSVDLAGVAYRDAVVLLPDRLEDAREKLAQVVAGAEIVDALAAASLALGVDSVRATLLALRTARAVAALDGRTAVSDEDAALAARLVLAPRATRLPAAEPESAETADQPDDAPDPQAEPGTEAPRPDHDDDDDDTGANGEGTLSDLLLAAAAAAIPAGLLARLQAGQTRGKPGGGARQGVRQAGGARGRPAGVRAAAPGPGLRLNLMETLRAAAPWQTWRREGASLSSAQVLIRRDDFRVTRCEQPRRNTTIFLVDASGSAARNRLAEAKGAVELLLADCYRRRDQVAVIAFRGKAAQVLLAPTRALVRAKRGLAGLPGGGGTPLAAGMDAGAVMAGLVRRGGATPILVVLTDGRANVTRAGTGGRALAASEAAQAARQIRAAGIAALVIDTSPRPGADASQLASSMGALYLPLPFANAAALSAAVRQAVPAGRP